MYGIFTYIYHKNQPNVGKYTSPMDPKGKVFCNLHFGLQVNLREAHDKATQQQAGPRTDP